MILTTEEFHEQRNDYLSEVVVQAAKNGKRYINIIVIEKLYKHAIQEVLKIRQSVDSTKVSSIRKVVIAGKAWVVVPIRIMDNDTAFVVYKLEGNDWVQKGWVPIYADEAVRIW